MSTNILLSFAAGVLAACLMMQSGAPPAAQGQQQAAEPEWEYKVVAFTWRPPVQQPEGLTTSQQSPEMLNELAADGWEYVGMVNSYHFQGRGASATGYVAFKRPRQPGRPAPADQ